MSEQPIEIELDDGRKWVVVNDVLYGAPAEVMAWVNSVLGAGSVAQMGQALGILKHGLDVSHITADTLPEYLVGGVYFFNEYPTESGYSDLEIAVHVQQNHSMRAATVRQIMAYPFLARGHRRLTAKVDDDRDDLKKQLLFMGFEHTTNLPKFREDGGVDLFSLYPENIPAWVRFDKMKEAA